MPMKRTLLVGTALAAGVVLGRFVVPEMEGRDRIGIQLSQDQQRGCSMLVAVEKTVLGRVVSTGEGGASARCGEFAEVAPDVRIVCDCDGLAR